LARRRKINAGPTPDPSGQRGQVCKSKGFKADRQKKVRKKERNPGTAEVGGS